MEHSRSGDERWWALGLFLLALVLRLVHLATVRHSPFFEYLILDPRMYDEWGQRIAAGDWLGQRPFFQDPLYPYLLALVYSVAGHSYLAVGLLQCLLGALVAPLLFAASRPWFGRAAAIVTGSVAALYLPSVYFEGLILKTWLAAFLVAVALWLLSRLLAGKGKRTGWFLTGLVWGLACLARGNLLLFVPFLVLWLLLDRPPQDGTVSTDRAHFIPDRDSLTAAVALLLGCGLVIGVTAVRNRAVGSEWILTTSNAGQNFFIGNNALNRTGQYTPLPFVDANPKYEERGFAREAWRRSGRELSPAQVSRFWFGQATAWIRESPGEWLRLLWRKTRNFWGAYEIPDNLDFYLYRETAPVLRLPLPGFGWIAPLGLLGGLLAIQRRGWPRLLLLFVVVYSASVVLFFVFSRFRLPMMPALFVLAGHGAVETVRRCRRAFRDPAARGAAARAVAVLLVCLAWVNLPVRAPEDSASIRLASALHLPRQPESSSTGHFNLGLAYAGRAKEADDPTVLLELAEVEMRLALAAEQRFARAYVELGKVLARQARDREAIEMYLQADRVEPGDYRTHHALGLLYRRNGDLAAAEVAFRRALSLEPRHAASAERLGRVLLELGRPEQAAEAFRHVLALDPDNRAAREGLAAASRSDSEKVSEP